MVYTIVSTQFYRVGVIKAMKVSNIAIFKVIGRHATTKVTAGNKIDVNQLNHEF